MIIYKTANLVNGKIYVGQDMYNRSSYLGSGKYLLRAIKKYGEENFLKEIIDKAETKQELDEKEKQWIKFYNCRVPNGYNISEGGGGNSGGIAWNRGLTKENDGRVKKISESMLGENNPAKRPEVRKKISKNNAMKRSDIRKKNSESQIGIQSGENNPMFGRKGENNPNFGSHRSIPTRKNMSESMKGKNKGRIRSDKFKKKQHDTHIGKKTGPRSQSAKDNMSKAKKGRSWEEIYGLEKAKQMKVERREKMKGNKYGRRENT